jgi:hypothetical protein
VFPGLAALDAERRPDAIGSNPHARAPARAARRSGRPRSPGADEDPSPLPRLRLPEPAAIPLSAAGAGADRRARRRPRSCGSITAPPAAERHVHHPRADEPGEQQERDADGSNCSADDESARGIHTAELSASPVMPTAS